MRRSAYPPRHLFVDATPFVNDLPARLARLKQAIGLPWDGLAACLGVDPRRSYTGGTRGWVGDSPFILLDTRRIRALGWKPELTIREGIERTLAYLERNPWLVSRRP